MKLKSKVYNWHEHPEPDHNFTPTIIDMDAGIGYMNRLVNSLLANILKALDSRYKLNKSKVIMKELKPWLDSDQQQKKFYDIVNKYIETGKQFDKQFQDLDHIRNERNFFIHNAKYDKNQKILVKEFNRLRTLIPLIISSENAIINDIDKNSKKIKTKENISKNKMESKIKSVIAELQHDASIYDEEYIPLSEVGKKLSENDILVKHLKEVLISLKIDVAYDKDNENVWYLKI